MCIGQEVAAGTYARLRIAVPNEAETTYASFTWCLRFFTPEVKVRPNIARLDNEENQSAYTINTMLHY